MIFEKHFYLLLVGFITFSCNKSMKHEEPTLNLNCMCCEKTNNIQGVYKGRLIERDFQPNLVIDGVNMPPVVVTKDTIIEVDVERTFEGLNSIEDSLVCAFKFDHFFNEPLRITNELIEKNIFEQEKYTVQSMNNDTIKISKTTYTSSPPKSPYNGLKYISVEFTGIKE